MALVPDLNNGNVIGINNPQEKLSINATNTYYTILDGTAKSFLNLTGNDFILGTYNNPCNGKLKHRTESINGMIN